MKEYKLISAQFFEHVLDEVNNRALEGWSVVSTINEFGKVKVILERDTGGDNPLSSNGLDTLTSLINLIGDEKKTLKLIADLKSAYATHVTGLDTLVSAQEDLQAKTILAEKAQKAAQDEKAELDTLKSQLEEAQSELVANRTAVEEDKKLLKQSQKDLEKAQKDQDISLKAEKNSIQKTLSAGQEELNKIKASLDARDKAISLRENSLSVREADADEIRLQAEALAKKVTGRRS